MVILIQISDFHNKMNIISAKRKIWFTKLLFSIWKQAQTEIKELKIV